MTERPFIPVSIGRARWLAEQFGAERIVVIAISGEQFSVTSYAEKAAVCRRLGEKIKAGELDEIAQEIAEA